MMPRRSARSLSLLLTPACVALLAAHSLWSCHAEPQKQADRFADERKSMVERQLADRDISNRRVLAAMRKVPRHEFVPVDMRDYAYADSPLPIGEGQTISQPYIVALMTQMIDPRPGYRVLEIGTGSGYQAAVLAELVKEVCTIEIVPALADRARATLAKLGYLNVRTRTGDGYKGWPEKAPFDGIIVTAAAEEVPKPLLNQLRVGGKLVMPVGAVDEVQELIVVTRTRKGFEREKAGPVRFVPLTGPLGKER